MPIDATDIDALDDYTDAQLLKATRAAIASITLTGTYRAIGGRVLTTASLPDLWAQVAELDDRIDADDGDFGDGIALVEFGRPV